MTIKTRKHGKHIRRKKGKQKRTFRKQKRTFRKQKRTFRKQNRKKRTKKQRGGEGSTNPDDCETKIKRDGNCWEHWWYNEDFDEYLGLFINPLITGICRTDSRNKKGCGHEVRMEWDKHKKGRANANEHWAIERENLHRQKYNQEGLKLTDRRRGEVVKDFRGEPSRLTFVSMDYDGCGWLAMADKNRNGEPLTDTQQRKKDELHEFLSNLQQVSTRTVLIVGSNRQTKPLDEFLGKPDDTNTVERKKKENKEAVLVDTSVFKDYTQLADQLTENNPTRPVMFDHDFIGEIMRDPARLDDITPDGMDKYDKNDPHKALFKKQIIQGQLKFIQDSGYNNKYSNILFYFLDDKKDYVKGVNAVRIPPRSVTRKICIHFDAVHDPESLHWSRDPTAKAHESKTKYCPYYPEGGGGGGAAAEYESGYVAAATSAAGGLGAAEESAEGGGDAAASLGAEDGGGDAAEKDDVVGGIGAGEQTQHKTVTGDVFIDD